MDTGIIEAFKGEHTHPSNPQKVMAMLEEVTVIETMVNTCGTQLLKPQHVLTKVLLKLKYSIPAFSSV